MHPELSEIEFSAVLEALRDPLRLGIVAALAEHDDVACGQFDLPVAKSAASRHFRILREAGVIWQRDDGTRRLNSLRREDLSARLPGLLDLAITEGAGVRIRVLARTA